MKKRLYYLTFLCFFIAEIDAKIGCMDDSDHLQSNYDTKDLHFVACTCPCTIVTDERSNLCLECYHYHEPTLFILPTRSRFRDYKKKSCSDLFIPEDPAIVLKKFVVMSQAYYCAQKSLKNHR